MGQPEIQFDKGEILRIWKWSLINIMIDISNKQLLYLYLVIVFRTGLIT